MKFKLSTSKHYYRVSGKRKLEELGFSFREPRIPGTLPFVISGAPEIEIASLEDLMQFIDKFGEIIISPDNRIEIYN